MPTRSERASDDTQSCVEGRDRAAPKPRWKPAKPCATPMASLKRERSLEKLGVERLSVGAGLRVASAKVTAAKGSVVDYRGEAIVNAANEGCLGGGGIDGAIGRAGGEELYQARLALPILSTGGSGTRCRTGDAKITIGGQLACKHVIHAVGPNYNFIGDEDRADELLYSAYASAMREARRHGLRDVAFCLISAGIFRGSRPLKAVLSIGVLAVAACSYEGLEEVLVVGFTREEVDLITEIVQELLVQQDAAAAREALLSELPPSVRAMHERALAGAEHDQPPVGIGIAWSRRRSHAWSGAG